MEETETTLRVVESINGGGSMDMDRFMQAVAALRDGSLYSFIRVYYESGTGIDSHPQEHQIIQVNSERWRH